MPSKHDAATARDRDTDAGLLEVARDAGAAVDATAGHAEPAPSCHDGQFVYRLPDTDADSDAGVADGAGIWGNNLAVDDAGFYFTEYGRQGGAHAVLRMPLRGEMPEVLWQGSDTGIFGSGMAVDDRVYFSAGTGLFALRPQSGQLDMLATFPSPCAPFGGVATDDQNVYAATVACVAPNPAVLVKVPRSGGQPTTLWSSPTIGISSIAIQDGFVYFATNAGDLRRIKTDGTSESVLASAPLDQASPPRFALTANHAYVLMGSEIYELPLDASDMTLVASVPMAEAIAADDSGIYVSVAPDSSAPGDTGSILRIEKDGTTTTLADGLYAAYLVLDSTTVYWSAPGEIGRFGKCAR